MLQMTEYLWDAKRAAVKKQSNKESVRWRKGEAKPDQYSNSTGTSFWLYLGGSL